jgi:hypothetical protein
MLVIPGIDPSYFDKDSRQITARIDIYFDGFENEPLEIYPSNYLVDFEITEEAGAETKNPLGAISANELSFTLTNFDNIFSPTNTAGPYYGKITTGVMIKVWLKPDEESITSWIPMGVFFVVNWQCKMGSELADILCTDTMQELLLAPIPDLDVRLNISFAAYFTYVLHGYGFLNAQIDSSLVDILPYGFISSDNSSEFMQALTEASISSLLASRYGIITVKKIARNGTVATFTDADQIMSVDVEQSILKTYSGVKLGYVLPQLSDDKEVLVVEAMPIPAGRTTHNAIRYPEPVFDISAVTLSGNIVAEVDAYTSTNFSVNVTTMLEGTDNASMRLSVTGKNIDLVEQELSDNLTNMLDISNVYIQSSLYAEEYKDRLSTFVSSEIPILEVNIRGNPLLEIGDTIQLNSDSYEIAFTGIIKRMTFKYNGALSCSMTLLNAEVV